MDYILGAEPSFGVFVLGYEDDPMTRSYMDFYKMGDGPGLHVLSAVPPWSARDHPDRCPGRAARRCRRSRRWARRSPRSSPRPSATCAPASRSTASVASRSTGCSRTPTSRGATDLLPMGLTDGATLVRDVAMDEALTVDDVRAARGSALRSPLARAALALRARGCRSDLTARLRGSRSESDSVAARDLVRDTRGRRQVPEQRIERVEVADHLLARPSR